jgi:hypothetical protein
MRNTLVTFFFLLFLTGQPFCLAQTPNDRSAAPWKSSYEKLVSKIGSWKTTHPDDGLNEYGSTTLSVLYRNESFLNSSFRSHVTEGSLKQFGGIDVGYAHMLIDPLELEVSAFFNLFKTTGNESPDEYLTNHMGVEAFLNCYVLPYIGHVSEWVFPYVGIGCQTSRLYNKGGDDAEGAMTLGTGGIIAKGGIKIRVSSGICIQASYKQTLPTGSEKLFRVVEAGVCLIN